MEKVEGQQGCCQVWDDLPAQVEPAAKRPWVRPGTSEDRRIRHKHLLLSNSRFIHSHVIQREMLKELRLLGWVENVNLILLFASSTAVTDINFHHVNSNDTSLLLWSH